MSEKYKFVDDEGIYHVTLTVVHWIDLFTRKDYAYEIIESLKFCQETKGLKFNRAGHRYISTTESYKVNDLEGLQEQVNQFHPLG